MLVRISTSPGGSEDVAWRRRTSSPAEAVTTTILSFSREAVVRYKSDRIPEADLYGRTTVLESIHRVHGDRRTENVHEQKIRQFREMFERKVGDRRATEIDLDYMRNVGDPCYVVVSRSMGSGPWPIISFDAKSAAEVVELAFPRLLTLLRKVYVNSFVGMVNGRRAAGFTDGVKRLSFSPVDTSVRPTVGSSISGVAREAQGSDAGDEKRSGRPHP
jgi:hypothetical protein